jgi:putative ABC transport system permease protein
MLNDLRFTLRSLGRQPGFAFAAVATLAVGIATTTAIFTTLNAALLRPLPFPHPEDLFAVYTPAIDGRFTTGRDSGVELARLNVPEVSIVRAAGSARVDSTILRDDGEPVNLTGYGVTEGFFDIFGLPIATGRGFTHEEHQPGAQPVAILSDRLWRQLYRSDPAIIGKPLSVANFGNNVVTIVGIAPPQLDVPRGADFWVAFNITPQSTGHGFDGYLRIKPGTNLERLNSEMAGAMSGIARDYGMLGNNRRYEIKPLVDATVGDLRPTLMAVFGAAALLLILACVNVMNLLLARGAVRAREVAVRVALGAGRRRIVRQLLTESLVLATLGTFIGVALAFGGLKVLLAYGAAELPRLNEVPFDVRVLAFMLVVLLVVGVIVGFAPALRLAGTSLKGLMNESGRSATGSSAHRTLRTMVVAEIALAITLVAGAGWLLKSFANLNAADPGFVSHGRIVFDVQLPAQRILPPPPAPPMTREVVSARVTTWVNGLTDRMRGIAGITGISTAASLPFGTDRDSVLYIGVQGEAADLDHPVVARAHSVGAGFFDTMGIKVLAGRAFTDDDRVSTQRVAVVNRTFARRYLGERDPLTAQFAAGYPTIPLQNFMQIVGVVEDVKYVSLAQPADPAYYVPMAQAPFFFQTVVVKTSFADPSSLAAPLQAAMKEVDPLIPITPRPFDAVVAASLNRQRLGMTLMVVFGVTALVLAGIGIYGVIAYASSQRAGEIATRMALGATPADAFWLLMNQGRALAVAGSVAGAAIAYAAGRIGSSVFFEVRASDPAVLAGAIGIVAAITVIAVLIPALRGSRIQASRVLRLE